MRMPEIVAVATTERPIPDEDGLTTPAAKARLAKAGPNEQAPVRRAAGLIQVLLLFANPLVIILLIASAVSAFVGEFVNAMIIALMVVVSIVINFFQTWHSQRAAERLRGQVAPTATILRDGKWTELPWREVVPGDVFRLSAGDLVPADARLLQAKDLHVNQAALTGESLPVEKEAAAKGAVSEAAAENSAHDRHAVFLGTSVVSGTATAFVTATGPATAFGDIAARLAARPPETEFERGTKQFGYLIMKTIFFLVFFVLLVSIVLRHNPLESVLFALALAVGLTPEFLPMITTVTLGRGALHMARQKVIVKHLEAIQNFGSMDVLCSDKTGTLTSGEMTLSQHSDALGNPSDHALLLGYLNGTYESGVKNPINVAILKHDPLDISAYRKVDEIPFDFERRRLSVVTEAKGEILLITKGAPESVLTCCSQYEVNGQAQPLDSETRAKCQTTYDGLSAAGYRVLAVASRTVPQQEVYRLADEKDLVLAGFLAFSDPPLADAAESLEALRRDGVRVKILTGDSELVAQHICSQVALDAKHIVLGDELDRMSDAALAHVAEKTIVFARVSPMQKHRIILALKGRGHVVGYLGDGINDAPSLHAADVGISVATAVDVAKDAADIILLERSLRVLHQGILEGRRAFGNVMKYLLMGTSSNFGNMFSMAAAAVFLPFLPMLPTQILLNNFLYDLAQITIPTDNVDQTYSDKPRRWDIKLIRDFMIYIGPLSSIYDFLTFYALLKIFHASEALFHTGWFVESLATQTLVLFVIRTAGNPFRSRPSLPLAITTVLIVVIGILLPWSPLAAIFGFIPLPITFFLFLGAAVLTYLLLVELVKRRLMGRRARVQRRPSRLR
ncbi:MAG: magnesium-translocating P-type ATPase [Acidobacteria bacterium]|nr:magnesium-translocating P-type ATPase [Acidobacteriota bacterium]MBI3428148.1 magnesium-translocating P-type ATPase [Acidobacteriota bacterium]